MKERDGLLADWLDRRHHPRWCFARQEHRWMMSLLRLTRAPNRRPGMGSSRLIPVSILLSAWYLLYAFDRTCYLTSISFAIWRWRNNLTACLLAIPTREARSHNPTILLRLTNPTTDPSTCWLSCLIPPPSSVSLVYRGGNLSNQSGRWEILVHANVAYQEW